MSSPGGMCEQGSGVSKNQLFFSLFAIKWTMQEIVLSSVNFQLSWVTINTKTKLVLPSAPLISVQPCHPRCVHGHTGTWRFLLHGGAVSPLHLPLPQKVSKGLERGSDGCGLLLSESPVYICGLIPSLSPIHPFLGADGFCRVVLGISMASALHGCFHSLICQCKQ